MSSEVKTILRDRLKQNYEAYIAGLQGKSASELINLASEITAAKQVCEELPDACDEEDMSFLGLLGGRDHRMRSQRRNGPYVVGDS